MMPLTPIGDMATATISSAASVPSSAIHRWKLDDVASGTATDYIGSADGTVNGVSSVSGTYQGGSAGDGDGSNNITTATLGSFGSSLDGNLAFAFTIDGYTGGTNTLFGLQDTGTSGDVHCHSFCSLNHPGDVVLRLIDSTGASYRVVTDSGGHIDGNKKVRVLMNKTGNTGAGGVDIYTATPSSPSYSSVSVSAPFDDNPTYFEDFTDDFVLFGTNNPGGVDKMVDAILDDFIIYDSDLTSGERQDDIDIQPWS